MPKAKFLLAAFLVPALAAPVVPAQTGGKGARQAAPTVKFISIPFQEFKLKNGLRVILSEDHSAPTYSNLRHLQRGFPGRAEGPHGLCPPD